LFSYVDLEQRVPANHPLRLIRRIVSGSLILPRCAGGSSATFHHHATLCFAAYGFLISERETISPSREWSLIALFPPHLCEAGCASRSGRQGVVLWLVKA
jgi:hypothetical protein